MFIPWKLESFIQRHVGLDKLEVVVAFDSRRDAALKHIAVAVSVEFVVTT